MINDCKRVKNIVGKVQNAGYQNFLLWKVKTLDCEVKTNTSAKSINPCQARQIAQVDTSQNFLPPWNFLYVNSLPEDAIILDRSNLKAFADDKIKVLKMMIFLFDRVENIVGKGENAGYQHFLLFP